MKLRGGLGREDFGLEKKMLVTYVDGLTNQLDITDLMRGGWVNTSHTEPRHGSDYERG